MAYKSKFFRERESGGGASGEGAPALPASSGSRYKSRFFQSGAYARAEGASGSKPAVTRERLSTGPWERATPEQTTGARGGGINTAFQHSGQSRDAFDASVRDRYGAAHPEETGGEWGAITRGLNSGGVKLPVGEQRLNDVIAKYGGRETDGGYQFASQEGVDAFREAVTAYQADFDDYDSAVQRYDTYTSPEEVRRRADMARAKTDALEQQKAEKSKLLSEIEQYRNDHHFTSSTQEKNQLGSKMKELRDEIGDMDVQIASYRREAGEEERAGTAWGYQALMREADFGQYAALGAAEPENLVTDSRDDWETLAMAEVNNTRTAGKAKYRFLTDDEVSVYNYLLAKEGPEAARTYLDDMEETLNYRSGTAQGKGVRGIENPVGRTAMTALYGTGAGLDQFASGTRQLFSKERLPTSETQFGSGYIREDLADSEGLAGVKLPDWLGGASLGQMAYDTVTTGANMAPSILLSALTGGAGAPAAIAEGVGAAAMGASAAGNAYNQAMGEGYSSGEARNYAVLVGASEGGLQYLLGGIGALGGKVSGKVAQTTIRNIDNALLRISADLGTHMFSEGAEEYLQDILEPAFRNLCFDERNEIKLVSADAAYSFLMGALTAGLMEGVPGAVRNTQHILTGHSQTGGVDSGAGGLYDGEKREADSYGRGEEGAVDPGILYGADVRGEGGKAGMDAGIPRGGEEETGGSRAQAQGGIQQAKPAQWAEGHL